MYLIKKLNSELFRLIIGQKKIPIDKSLTIIY